jgi:parallel beta-helix repeat protein
LKRQDRVRQTARRIFGAGFLILLLLVVYLGFFPAPADRPTDTGEAVVDFRVPCERKVGSRRLDVVVHSVLPGDSIQDALDRAQPGDTVAVLPGTYHESLRIETDALLLIGLAEGGERPVLDGADELQNGIVACANAVTLEGFDLRGFTANGVVVQDVDRAEVRDIVAEQTGERGIFVLHSQRVNVENSLASGAAQGGIVVSQSEDVAVRGSEAFNNPAGFAVVASSQVRVEGGHAHDNATGILVALLPDLEVRGSRGVVLRNNRVVGNNLETAAGELRMPVGTGILLAADRSEVTGNEIRENRTAGVAVLNLRRLLPDRQAFNVGTVPEGNWIHGNAYAGNGGAPDPAAGFGADLLWDLSGWDNLWSERGASRVPQLLPGPDMPDFIRRGLWRVLTILRQLEAAS